MKKRMLLISLGILSINLANARSYPIQEITPNGCTQSGCTYKLPTIKDANYLKYKNDKIYRQTYSMLWSTTYYDGRDLGIGGHQGVDIATAKGSPVYAAAEGTVIFAGDKGNRGNTITIKHIQNGKTLYTSYSHLSTILVVSGTIVKEGEKIAKVGDTGNTTGPHLHFQIEINDDNNHPFFYKNCIGEIEEIVNEGRCIQQMKQNTVDPILFIEKQGDIPLNKEAKNQSTIQKNDYTKLVFTGFTGGLLDKSSIEKINITSKISGEFLVLDTGISISYDKNIIKILPDNFNVIKNKQLLIIPQGTGITIINFKYNNKIFKKIPIIITDQNFFEKIKTALNKDPNLIKKFLQ